MTAVPSVDPARFLHDELAQASPDLMRELLTTFVNALLSAQADAVCGAEYGARDPERVNRRNGYRHRELDTRVGTLDVAVPKPRSTDGPVVARRSGASEHENAPVLKQNWSSSGFSSVSRKGIS
jgi:transposase-like protein